VSAITDEALRAAAQAWLAQDPDPDTRAELTRLLNASDSAALAERFAGRLQFGTAGLRGELGAGPMRMNRIVVGRAAAGLASYLQARGGGPVVIGYDARHRSDVFARDSAEIVSGAGLPAMLLPRPLPTPVLAYAVRALGAAAGVMVTASHNPPRDNGYKVYLGDGAQIAPPADAEISAAIDAVGPLSHVPRGDGWQPLGEEIVESYVAAVAAVAPGAHRDLRVAYTPLHGVGRDVLLAAFTRAGFAAPTVVAAQGDPDPDFPTVPFPNPEEPGATDALLALAAETGADLALANDPDADRCAAVVAGRQLTGDQVGVLLADHLLRHGRRGRVATTIVSSTLLRKLAASYRVPFSETLTGFKWIVQAGPAAGADLAYGYEEALGYCVAPALVRDKDGISAALLLADLAAELKAAGRTLLDRLAEITAVYGLHATGAWSVRASRPGEIAAGMDRLRAHPPRELGGRAVISAVDLRGGSLQLPPTDALVYRLADNARVVVRPSGTEPKLKAYLEVVVGAGEAARARAELAALRADLAVASGLG
jgi:phosphomannomutase